MHHTLSWPRWDPEQLLAVLPLREPQRKGNPVTHPTISAEYNPQPLLSIFRMGMESMGKEGWPKLVCSPGPSLQSQARPRLVTRTDVEGIQPWRCRSLESYVSEQTLQPIKVWIPSGGHILDWLPHGRQSSFCSQWDQGKGDAEFLMWPTNFQLVPIKFLNLSETELC